MVIVVLPYKFLSAFHFGSMKALVSDKTSMSIGLLENASINESTMPDFLTSGLPRVLFATVDSMATLVRFHGTFFCGLVESQSEYRRS